MLKISKDKKSESKRKVIDLKLNQYIETKRHEKFEWGKCDCVLFTGDWCEFLTGKNPAEGAHGKYHDEICAYRFLKENYNKQPEDAVDNLFKRVDKLHAKKGDIALCELNGKELFGIIGARGIIFFKTGDGVLMSKLADVKIAWRVE